MKLKSIALVIIAIGFTLLNSGCSDKPLNNPHARQEEQSNTYYASFTEPPKTLDPARSYSSNEALFTAQIYGPPLQYHYLKRPFTLIPLTATTVPKPIYLDKIGKPLPTDAAPNQIAYSVYRIQIKPDIYYQPHPAFAKDKQGRFLYHHLSAKDLGRIQTLQDFKHTGTRELTADDYIYQIKRLAHPKLHSPIFGLMSKYIVGLNDYAKVLKQAYKGDYLDLHQYNLTGVKRIDRYTYAIKLKGKYPQFKYWLAMPFFAPVPWEADYFYAQSGMQAKNIGFDWYPVGTGPYMLVENNPNRKMILAKNPHFHWEFFPTQGEVGDAAVLVDAGKLLPFIDRFDFSLEKESIPRWTKFLQGYYDASGIGADNFDQAIQIDAQAKPYLTPAMQAKKLRLQTSINPAIFYMGFNMLDDVVGGYSVRAQKLRQAIAIGLNYEEFITIFLNGRGIVAQGPLPPGIYGYAAKPQAFNPYVYALKNGKPKRKTLAQAKQLLAQAGYPNGRSAITGKPLILHLDVTGTGPDDKARYAWMRKQFGKLGIQLNVRATQYNRFQAKMRSGNAQLFMWGWMADYPDPENFLFLLYGANGKVKFGGENAANYSNPQYDKLFAQMRHLENGPKRQQIIQQMLAIARADSPWVWGFHPQEYQLSQQWVRATKPSQIANNTLKYLRIDPKQRAEKRKAWNQPILWPLGVLSMLILFGLLPVIIKYWCMQHRVE